MAGLSAGRSPAAGSGTAGASRSQIPPALLALGVGLALVFALTRPPHQAAPLPEPPSQFVGLVVEVDGETYMMDPLIPRDEQIVTPLSPTMEGAEASFLIDAEVRAGRCVIEWDGE